MAPHTEASPRGLHLGWIPNEPGRRPRDFPERAPGEPAADPAKLRKAQDGQHWSGLRRVLVFSGVLALALFGGLGALSHKSLFWAVGGGLAALCWLAALASARAHRKAVKALAQDESQRAERHAADLARHEEAKVAWGRAEADRVASVPRWLKVSSAEGTSRLDVFGGTPLGRRNMIAGLGGSLLAEHAVIVLDLSQDRACEGLLAAARQAGTPVRDYLLPRDLAGTPLLAGLTGEQVASLIVEVLHADDPAATAAGRATDLMVMRKVIAALDAGNGTAGEGAAGNGAAGANAGVSMRQIRDALAALLAGPVEGSALGEQFPPSFRREVAGSLIRLAAIVEPLKDLGADRTPPPAARLTCLSLADGPRDVTADLTAALVVQWATQGIDGASGDGPRPAVVLIGADEQAIRHLSRLTTVCERHEVPLVRAFSRLTEDSARHLDTRNTAFMRLATRGEALRAAEHIGLERRFVAGRFTHSRSVSQSRTRTRGESVTHTTGTTTGEGVTKTTGTTTGESTSQTQVQRRSDHADGFTQGLRDSLREHREATQRDDSARRDGSARDSRAARDARAGRESGTDREGASGRDGSAGAGKAGERADPGAKSGARPGGTSAGAPAPGHADNSKKRGAPPRGGAKGGSGRPGRQGLGLRWGNGAGQGWQRKSKKPVWVDYLSSKTQTRYNLTHSSEAKTQSWAQTEETSRTTSQSWSKTDGTSVGDEITYELSYDHKVAPETLMGLPEDQMLAAHIVEGAAVEGGTAAGAAVTGAGGAGIDAAGQTKMVALVVDPAVIGDEPVAHVLPGEIPAYQPPAPAVSGQVPDYRRAPELPGRT